MTNLRRRVLIGTAITAGIVLVAVAVMVQFLDVDRRKASIEESVSRFLGLAFTIRGTASLRLFPHPRLTLNDIHVSDDSTEIFSAATFHGSPRLIPFLFRRRVSFDRATLESPKIRLGATGPVHSKAELGVPSRPRRSGAMSAFTVEHGDVTYLDPRSGDTVALENLDLSLTDVSWSAFAERGLLAWLKSLSFHGTLAATTLRLGNFEASEVKTDISGQAGLVQLDSTETTIFGGSARGSLTVDLRESPHRFHLVQAAPELDLAQAFPVDILRGKAKASLDLEATGDDREALTATTTGQVSIRGGPIAITSLDVDGLIGDYNRSQNFSIIDLGSLLVAGPFAPLVTRTARGAQLRFLGHGGKGKSEIRVLVSDWRLLNGVATTEDVVFATADNTVAFRGSLDLRTGTYREFFVATVDHRGCAQVKQKIQGAISHPDGQGPASLFIGPFKSVFRKITKLFEPNRCDRFYTGSALHAAAASP